MELIDGRYQIGGCDVLDLCTQFSTPLYVYNTAKMRERYESLTEAFSGTRLSIKYACKALTNPAVLRFLRSLGAGVDTVSIQEVHLALEAGFTPESILFTPNCVAFEEIQQAVELGVHVNIDNIPTLERFGDVYGGRVPVCIRINPHILAGANPNISVGHIDSKFGISIHQMRHVHRVVDSHGIHVNGIHMHTGSDILSIDSFVRAAEVLFDYAESFPKLDFVDFGSGFKVAYREGDVTTNVAELGERLTPLFNEFCTRFGRDLELWFEPGKYLVSESGTFLVESNVVKQTPAAVFAGVNSGMNHLLRPMFYDSYHHIVNVSNPGGNSRIYTVVGYICETDTFGLDRSLSEVREGDILAFQNAGAYGISMASNYNSRLRPAEVLIHEGQAHLIRRRETLEDLTRCFESADLQFEA